MSFPRIVDELKLKEAFRPATPLELGRVIANMQSNEQAELFNALGETMFAWDRHGNSMSHQLYGIVAEPGLDDKGRLFLSELADAWQADND